MESWTGRSETERKRKFVISNCTKITSSTPLCPPWRIPSSITSMHTRWWGKLRAVCFACCLATFKILSASERAQSLSVLWRERNKGLRHAAISSAHWRDTSINFAGGTTASTRPNLFPSSDVIGLDVCKSSLLSFHQCKQKTLFEPPQPIFLFLIQCILLPSSRI